jgi:SAM-dependent methyltransferase
MFKLSTRQRDRILQYQRDEIARLAIDKEFAAACSQRPHYSRIGCWLTPGGRGRVLELGCGPGRYVAMLASMGYDVVGVDPIKFDTWEIIRRAHPAAELTESVFAENLPYDFESFDHVVCLSALLYFERPDRALAEIRRVLKPGGRLIVRTISRDNLVRRLRGHNIDPATKNVFSLSELREFLATGGFRINDGFSYGFFPPILTSYWWYLANGPLSVRSQESLSNLTPSSMRLIVTVFAERDRNDVSSGRRLYVA